MVSLTRYWYEHYLNVCCLSCILMTIVFFGAFSSNSRSTIALANCRSLSFILFSFLSFPSTVCSITVKNNCWCGVFDWRNNVGEQLVLMGALWISRGSSCENHTKRCLVAYWKRTLTELTLSRLLRLWIGCYSNGTLFPFPPTYFSRHSPNT